MVDWEEFITVDDIVTMMTVLLLATSVFTYFAVYFIEAPYGRFSSSSWGPLLPANVAWFLQELPSFLVPFTIIALKTDFFQTANVPMGNVVCLSLMLTHYFQRSLIYPFLINGGKPTPFTPFALAFLFCIYNGILQGLHQTQREASIELTDVSTVVGVLLFFSGFIINLRSDHILRNLRRPGESGYRIPTGGLFDYVSCANYFGEMLEWFGYALASWSLPALAFFLFTCSNLIPRALSYHKWYLLKFENYPKERTAVIPFLL